MSDRIPPHNLDSEMAVLGACMVERTMVPIVAQHVTASCFYAMVHETVWAIIARLYDADQPTDKLAVAAELRSNGHLERVGGLSYLNQLLETVQTTASAEYHAKIVREKAVLRELIHAGTAIVQMGFSREDDPRAAVDDAEQLIRDVGNGIATEDLGQTAQTATGAFWREIDGAFAAPNKNGMKTPWDAVNKLTGGFHGGEMVIWPAAAKMGKSAALNTLARFTAEHDGLVLYFVLEMGWRNTNRRMIATAADIETRFLRTGDLTPFEWDRLAGGMQQISELPLRYFNRRKSVADIRRIARRLNHDEPVKSIIVDHIGFLDEVTRRARGQSMNEALNLAYIELLHIAEEIGCVMHVAAHINREGMKGGEPRLEHIRDGGNPEGHAHVIISPFRADPINDPVTGKFIVLANREGITGGIDMSYEGRRLLWRELTNDEYGQRPRALWFEAAA